MNRYFPQTPFNNEMLIDISSIKESRNEQGRKYIDAMINQEDKVKHNQKYDFAIRSKEILTTWQDGPDGAPKFRPRLSGPYQVTKKSSHVSYQQDLGRNNKRNNTSHADKFNAFYN
jgi:hypothetical protein